MWRQFFHATKGFSLVGTGVLDGPKTNGFDVIKRLQYMRCIRYHEQSKTWYFADRRGRRSLQVCTYFQTMRLSIRLYKRPPRLDLCVFVYKDFYAMQEVFSFFSTEKTKK